MNVISIDRSRTKSAKENDTKFYLDQMGERNLTMSAQHRTLENRKFTQRRSNSNKRKLAKAARSEKEKERCKLATELSPEFENVFDENQG